MLWLAAGIGRAILRAAGVAVTVERERWLFGLALGAGAISYTVLALGLAGLLTPAWIVAALAALAVLARHDLAAVYRDLPELLRSGLAVRRSIRSHDRVLAIAVPVVELLLVLVAIEALAPPTGYDALMYHLQGPKRFLELGRIAPLADVQQANMPFTIDMLFLVGLAFGSDELGNLLHFAFMLTLVAAIYSFAREFLEERIGWIASIIFLSTTMMMVFAPIANVDYGLTLFDFLSVYAFVRWLRCRDVRWLGLSGALAGLALGTKYFGGVTTACLGVFLLVTLVRSGSRPREIARLLLTFGLPAVLIASPWYIKSWLWLGTPLWPYFAPARSTSTSRSRRTPSSALACSTH